MCGIVGFITTESKKGETDRSKFMRHALIVDTLRGDDSTGVFAVGHEPLFEDGSAYWLKQLGPGYDFVNSKDYWENLYDTTAYRCMVGHNRAATVGGVTTDGAHPFQEGPITLVHNGTLTSTYSLPMPMSGLEGVTVDSHAICHNLAEHSVEDVVEELNGAFALVWHDARDNSINVIRNRQRPLHFALNSAKDTLYFMSEGGMLHMLGDRIKLGLKDIYYPKEGQHLKWLPDTELGRPIVKTLELWEDSWKQHYPAHGYNTYGGYDWRDDDDYYGRSANSGKAPARSETEDYIFVGGRKKPVPMLLQEALLQHDVVIEDRLRFTPQSSGLNPQDKDRIYIAGTLEGRHRAMLLSCPPHFGNDTDRDWMVRVIAVKMTPEGEPIFLCKIVSTLVDQSKLTSDRPFDSGARSMLGYDQVPGQDGFMVSASEFYRTVVDGCVMCTAPISIRDAYDLIWTGEGAICPNCDDRLYEPPSGSSLRGVH